MVISQSNQMENNTVIVNQDKLDSLIALFKKDGVNSIQVASDFDRTLTRAFINGQPVFSIISLLRNGNYLSKTYAKKAHDLFAKYHPIELETAIPIEEKHQLMYDWWSQHYDLLIKEKLHKSDIDKAVSEDSIQLRDNFHQLIKTLRSANIPLVILSSGGLGVDGITSILAIHNISLNGIFIISNQLQWDDNGYLTGVKRPLIHLLNKHEIQVKNFPFYEQIKNRPNVILLGDSLGDVSMVEGLSYKNVIKVGYLNHEVDEYIASYKRLFDIIVLNDGTLRPVINLISKIRDS